MVTRKLAMVFSTVVTTVKALSVAAGEFVKAGVYGGPEAGLDVAHTLPQSRVRAVLRSVRAAPVA